MRAFYVRFHLTLITCNTYLLLV